MDLLQPQPDAGADHHAAVDRERHRGRASPRAARPTPCCTCWRSRANRASRSPSTTSIGSAASAVTGRPQAGGRFVATDLHRAGGIRLVAQRLLDAGLLHADQLTVTGKTLGEEARSARETAGQEVVRPLDRPIKPTGGLVILKGNLAPEGAVVKVAGSNLQHHRGPARVFDGEQGALDAVLANQIKPGDVVGDPLRRPTRRAGHARDARRDGGHRRRGARRVGGDGDRRAVLRRDARADGGPRRARGGRRAVRLPPFAKATRSCSTSRTGGSTSSSPEREIAARLKAWKAPAPRYTSGVMAKYARLVSSAAEGAITG